MGVGIEIVLRGSAAKRCSVGLHPAWRTPRGCHEKKIRFDPQDLAQCRQDVGLILLQAEVVQVHVIGNIVIGVDATRVIARADAATAYIQVQSRGRIDVSQKSMAGGGRHSTQKETGGISERGAKAKDRLELTRAVNFDGGGRRTFFRLRPLQGRACGVLLRCIRYEEGCRLGSRALRVYPPGQQGQRRTRGRAAKKVPAICHQPRPIFHSSNVLPYHGAAILKLGRK
jgi:hypothetical protein